MNRDEEADFRPAPEKIAATAEVDQPALVRIHEHRHSAQLENRQRCCEGRERGGEHRISWPAPENLQRNLDCVQAARDSDRVPGSPKCRECRFKFPNFIAQNVPTALGDLEERRRGVLADVLPLACEVVSWDHNPIQVKHLFH